VVVIEEIAAKPRGTSYWQTLYNTYGVLAYL